MNLTQTLLYKSKIVKRGCKSFHVSKLFNIPKLALECNDNIHFSTLKTKYFNTLNKLIFQNNQCKYDIYSKGNFDF